MTPFDALGLGLSVPPGGGGFEAEADAEAEAEAEADGDWFTPLPGQVWLRLKVAPTAPSGRIVAVPPSSVAPVGEVETYACFSIAPALSK